MSELIDRQELLKCFCITKDGKRIPEVDCDNREINISIKDIKRIIREQPTVNTRTPMANIVEKLEEYAKSKICDNHKKGCPYGDNDDIFCENCGALGAISIVKQEINNGLE